MLHFKTLTQLFVASSLALTACKPQQQPKAGAAPAPTSNATGTGSQTPYTPVIGTDPTMLGGSTLDIRIIGQIGITTLNVALNQPSSWQFEAVAADGITRGTISRILVNGQASHPSMIISQNTVQFTPRSNNDLNGTLTVYANSTGSTSSGMASSSTQTYGGTEIQKTFYWGNGGTGGYSSGQGSNPLTQMLIQTGIGFITNAIGLGGSNNTGNNLLNGILGGGNTQNSTPYATPKPK